MFLLGADLLRVGAMEPGNGYHHQGWTTDDGLPHNNVTRVVQDRVGYIWLATAGGLSRFDGRVFRDFPVPAEYRRSGLFIRGLVENGADSLLVLPTSGQVLQLRSSVWSVHPLSETLTKINDIPGDLYVEPGGVVWLATYKGYVLRWEPSGAIRVFGQPGGGGLALRTKKFTFAPDEAGNTWIASDGFLAVYRDGELKSPVQAPEGSLLIAAGTGGRIWLCTKDRLLRIDRGRLVTESGQVPWEDEFASIRHLVEDSKGCLWISSSRRGLYCYEQGKINPVASPYSAVWSVFEDREGDLWVSTDGSGASLLRRKSYRIFSLESGMREALVSTVAEDNGGNVWLANRPGGLASIAPGESEARPLHASRHTFANVVCVDGADRLWFGGGRSGLRRVASSSAVVVEKMPVPEADLRLLFRASNGDIWYAAGNGQLGYYRNDQPYPFSDAEVLWPREVRTIAEAAGGTLWMGGPDGYLWRLAEGRFERFGPDHGFPGASIYSLWVDKADTVWIGTSAGLIVKQGEQFHQVTQLNGLKDDLIMQVIEDDRECMWFASRRGLFSATKADLLAFMRGEIPRVISRIFGRDAGLVGFTPIANYQPAACKTRDGRLWFATSVGAVVVDPASLPRNLPAVPVEIAEVRADGAEVPMADPIKIPSVARRVEFRFSALSYMSPANVALRHRLDGVDRDWVETGTDRLTAYTNLHPGSYLLRVIAHNSAGQWNEKAVELAVTIVPAWWEHSAFRLGFGLLLLIILGWSVRVLSQRRLRLRLARLEQENTLKNERERIARDLHDDLGASLTEIGLLADRLVGAAPRELAPQLSGLAWRTRRLATELAGIVFTMTPENTTLDRLARFVRRYVERLFRNTGTTCLVKGVESIPVVSLSPDEQYGLLAAIKESLNNILKHAHATKAQVDLSYEADTFIVRISDNGDGFIWPPATAHEGNGLRNIGTRLTRLGGTLEITSAPGGGATLTLRFNVATRPAVH